MTKTKKIIKEKIGEFDPSSLSGSFSEICSELKELEQFYWSRYPNSESIKIQFEIIDHEDSYSRYEQFSVYRERLETEKEYKARTKKPKNKEYETYLKLKKKYEKRK